MPHPHPLVCAELVTWVRPSWRPAGVRGGERPQFVCPEAGSGSVHTTCNLAITRSGYPTVLVMAAYLPTRQTLLDSRC
jgi:hypothetical protein